RGAASHRLARLLPVNEAGGGVTARCNATVELCGRLLTPGRSLFRVGGLSKRGQELASRNPAPQPRAVGVGRGCVGSFRQGGRPEKRVFAPEGVSAQGLAPARFSTYQTPPPPKRTAGPAA